MVIAGALALGLSAACLVGAVLAWSGRWRSWTGEFLWSLGAAPITLLPAVAAGALAGGHSTLGVISSASPVALACFAVLVAGGMLSLIQPDWWGPRWYRARDRSVAPDTRDPATALVLAGVRATGPLEDRPARSQAPAALGPALQTWRGSWIAGTESEPAAHGATHAGAVEGRLQLHADAVSFVASRVEDLLRDAPTVLMISASELRDVRVVPAGAGPDGRRTEGSGPRSLFSRLVLDTEDGAYLFEVQAARRTARRINDKLRLDALR